MSESTALFGSLDQHSLQYGYPQFGSGVASVICGPAAATNSLAYLQNANPGIYGTSLIQVAPGDEDNNGVRNTYDNWVYTAGTGLASSAYMNTSTAGGVGTWHDNYLRGFADFIEAKAPGKTQYLAQDYWSPAYWGNAPSTAPHPSWVSSGAPDWSFFYNALSRNAAVTVLFSSVSSSVGHYVSVTGMTWDTSTNSGTLAFVNPWTGGFESTAIRLSSQRIYTDYYGSNGSWIGLAEAIVPLPTADENVASGTVIATLGPSDLSTTYSLAPTQSIETRASAWMPMADLAAYQNTSNAAKRYPLLIQGRLATSGSWEARAVYESWLSPPFGYWCEWGRTKSETDQINAQRLSEGYALLSQQSFKDATNNDIYQSVWVKGGFEVAQKHLATLQNTTVPPGNAAFSVVNNQLRTTAALNYEAASSYSLRVFGVDPSGFYTEFPLTVRINDLNEAPTDIALSATSIAENNAVNAAIGTLSATDADAGNTFTYTLVAGTGSTDNGSFTIRGGQLLAAASFDYETKSSYSFRVRATDQGGLYTEKVLTIAVTNVNESPTAIAISATTVAENTPVGSVVGTLSTSDIDAIDTFTYALVAGTGSADNASFCIVGQQLRTAASFNYEAKSSYTVRVRSTDAGGLTTEKVVPVTISDVAESGTEAPTPDFTFTELLDSSNSFLTYFRQGDSRGEFFYDPSLATLRVSGPYELARFQVGRRWNEFQFEIKVSALSFGNFDLLLTNGTSQYVIKLGGLLTVKPDWQTVRLTYDEGSRTLTAFINGVQSKQASTLPPNWNTTFNCTLFSGSGQNSIITVQNARVGSPTADTTPPTAAFVALPSPVSSAISSVALAFSEPVSGVSATQFTLRRDGLKLDTSSSSITVSGTTCTLSGLSAVTANTGSYSLEFEDVQNVVRDAAGNSVSGKAVLSWTTTTLGATAVLALLDNRDSFLTYFKQGDNRGEFFYDPALGTLRVSGPYELARFGVGRRWSEFQFEIKVSELSFGNFDLVLTNGTNQYVIQLGGLLTVKPDWQTVRLTYDEGSRTLTAFINGVQSKQASVLATNWNAPFNCTLFSGGGQNAVITVRNASVASLTNFNSPSGIALSASSIAENSPVETVVGNFATTDIDIGDAFTYSLVAGTGSTDNASFSVVGNQLKTAASFNYETKNSYSVRVRSTDTGGLTTEKQFTISVTNVNETPADIALSATSIAENNAVGATIGTLSTTDLDAGNTFTYTLVAGIGSTDNASFTISGTQLLAAASFNYEAKNSYSVRIRSTDQGGLFTEKVFTITVTDVNETPAVIALRPARMSSFG